MSDMFKRIKKQNGEKFAQTIRNFHNGLLEIPDIDMILRHAGREAEPLLPYLMSLLAANDDAMPAAPQNPFSLLEQAGYNAFYVDTLEKQNSIKRYFKPGELLCTFNDSARYQDYHIVHAVRKDVDQIRREDFKGREERQDDYGTSVISIQMLKDGGFISIKNRYNHAVAGCDNTFGSNPDNIIDGLSLALKDHFNVDFSSNISPLPEGYALMGKQVFKYHQEKNNIYYGDQAWAENGQIHIVDKSAGDALFDGFLFDNKSKTVKKIDPASRDSFADDFNRAYGGNPKLTVRKGNLLLDEEILIGVENSRIKTLYLPDLTSMGDWCLSEAASLTQLTVPALTSMGDWCLSHATALVQLIAPALTSMDSYCLRDASALTQLTVPALTSMGYECLRNARTLTQLSVPVLTTMDSGCLYDATTLTQLTAPALTSMGHNCLYDATSLTQLTAPALTSMGPKCLRNASAMVELTVPALTSMDVACLKHATALTHLTAPALTSMGRYCLLDATDLTQLTVPDLISIPTQIRVTLEKNQKAPPRAIHRRPGLAG